MPGVTQKLWKTMKSFLFLFYFLCRVYCWFVVTVTDYKWCELGIPALSRQGALFLFQLTLVALGVCGIVPKTGCLNSVPLPGGDNQPLQDDNGHLALLLVVWVLEDVSISREVRTSVKSPQMVLFWKLTGPGVEVGSRKIHQLGLWCLWVFKGLEVNLNNLLELYYIPGRIWRHSESELKLAKTPSWTCGY